MMRLLSKSPGTYFLAFYDAGRLCGFVYMATYGAVTFIIYLAVEASGRPQEYGSRILGRIERRFSENKRTLSIDRWDAGAQAQNDRMRRKHFT